MVTRPTRARLVEMAKPEQPKSIRALNGRAGIEYDEETFLHLLTIERARAERANQRLRLLLVTLEPVAGKPAPIPAAGAARLFEGLRQLLRDTDIVGWYDQGRVAGAVLTAPADAPGFETSGVIQQRVGDGLRQRLPASLAGSLRVRVTQHGPRRLEGK